MVWRKWQIEWYSLNTPGKVFDYGNPSFTRWGASLTSKHLNSTASRKGYRIRSRVVSRLTPSQ